MAQACYRKLRRYKYQLVEDYEVEVGIADYDIDTPHYALRPSGMLVVKKYYAWDGPSGPTIDTLNFMRGSLVHDALYQMMRSEQISFAHRDPADRLLQRICREDGMSRIRAWIVYQGVKWFAAKAARPGTQKPDKVICVGPT